MPLGMALSACRKCAKGLAAWVACSLGLKAWSCFSLSCTGTPEWGLCFFWYSSLGGLFDLFLGTPGNPKPWGSDSFQTHCESSSGELVRQTGRDAPRNHVVLHMGGSSCRGTPWLRGTKWKTKAVSERVCLSLWLPPFPVERSSTPRFPAPPPGLAGGQKSPAEIAGEALGLWQKPAGAELVCEWVAGFGKRRSCPELTFR